jgi:proteic killer suppression protein
VRVEYQTEELRLLAEDVSYRQARWDRDVVKAYRKKVQLLKAAVDERDVYAMGSLRLEKLQGDRRGTQSIRLNRKYRLVLNFHTDDNGRYVVVIELVDYH